MARPPPTLGDIGEVLDRAREAAVAYYKLTGRPLGITGEVGEYGAARPSSPGAKTNAEHSPAKIL